MSSLSVEELAALLHPQELEILEELAGEFEDLEDYEESEDGGLRIPVAMYRGSGSLSSMLLAANKAIRNQKTRGPKVAEAARGERLRRKADALNAVERERYEELGDELDELQKSGRRLPAVPSREEMKLLLKTAQDNHERDYVLIRLFYATGCRRSEMENLRMADLNFKEQTVFVRDGKGDKDRYVAIDKETADILNDFTYGRGLADPVFDIEDRQMNRRIQKWGRKAGLVERYEAQDRHFSAHCLRHAFATHLYEGGLDLYALRDLLGHRFLTTTKLYVHLGIGKILSKYESAHPLASGEFDDLDD